MSDNVLSLSDFDTMCRFCLLKTNNLQPVSELKVDVCSEHVLDEVLKLMAVADVKSASLPKGACQSCCSIVNLLTHFVYNGKMACKVLVHVLAEHEQKLPLVVSDTHGKGLGRVSDVAESQEGIKKLKCKSEPSTVEEEPMFVCEMCKQAFVVEKVLCEHLRRDHHVTKPFKCHDCDKAYPSWALLRVHSGTHTKPFRCDVCQRQFANNRSLKAHKLYHEGGQECDVCRRICTSRSALAIHKRKHTGEKPFTCHICGKMFPYVKNLSLHMRTHQDDYDKDVCYLCGYTSSIRSNYLKHVRRHTNERNHRCETCGKTFVEKCGLTKHIKKHCKGYAEEQESQQPQHQQEPQQVAAGALLMLR